MNHQKGAKFCVIELVDPPYIESKHYVCILSSWIQLRETADGAAFIKFPKGELSEINKRIEKNGNFSSDWMTVLADIKLYTNSYTEANNYMNLLNEVPTQEQNYMETLEEDIQSTLGKKPLETGPGLEMNEVHAILARLSVSAELASDHLAKSQRVSSLDQATRKISMETSKETSSCVKEKDKDENNQENVLLAMSTLELKAKFEIQEALIKFFGNDFKEKLIVLYKELENQELILENMRLGLSRNRNAIKTLIDITNEFDNSGIVSDAASKSAKVGKAENANKTVNEVAEREVQNEAQRAEGKEHSNDGNQDVTNTGNGKKVKNCNPLDKIRGQAQKFTFPPEYDRNDSKWTLKHRTKKKGLVELIPKSGVYVDALKLGNCKRMSKDSKALARMLLMEVFSENALSICSLTGKKANAFEQEGTSVRPGLDQHAMTVLLNYVEQHAIDQNWTKLSAQTLVETIRNKLQGFRAKSR